MPVNPTKCDDLDYIHSIVSTQRAFNRTQLLCISPKERTPLPTIPSQDCSQRAFRDTKVLWREAKEFVDLLSKSYFRCEIRGFQTPSQSFYFCFYLRHN